MSNYNSALQSNNTDLQAILNTINELPEAGEQLTPVISVSSNGLITATAGTKSSTHQLAFQAAKTITPTTANQIAVSSGYYTGGNVIVAGDNNLVAGNIKSGVSIFGVSGNYEGSGGDSSVEDGLVTRTLTSYTNNRVKTIGNYAFYNCSSLTSVSFPAVTTIKDDAFNHCRNLTSVSFPAVTTINSYAFGFCYSLNSVSFPAVISIGNSAFVNCSSLTSVSFPAVISIGNSAFYNCSSLASVSFSACKIIGNSAFYNCSSLNSVSFPAVTTIGLQAFYSCSRLSVIYLTGLTLCKLANQNAFSHTSIWSNKGSIFVPSSLVASYKANTNWAFFSNRIFSAP